jgi:starch synthase
MRRLRDQSWQIVILGTGSTAIEQSLQGLQDDFPNRVRAEIKYDAGLARQIYAGADLLLMPSRYEPCGLSQMIALRYGCVPIVSAVGGLRDTIFADETGFLVSTPTAVRLASAIKRAVTMLGDAVHWRELQEAGMSQDFSWRVSASKYLDLYQRLLAQTALG